MADSSVKGHGFFDAITQIFSGSQKPAGEEISVGDAPLMKMESDFNSALKELNDKIEEIKREKQQVNSINGTSSAESAAQEHARRKEEAHARILQDILAMHRKLETGVDDKILGDLTRFLEESSALESEGRRAQEIIPCCRSGILRHFQREAGKEAWPQLEAALAAHAEPWPVTVVRDHLDDDASFAKRCELKYREIFNDFVNYDIARSVELIRGIERGWQADYPDPDSPLWRELVFEGVATALRTRILKHYDELLLEHKELIIARATDLVGRELAELQRVLAEKNLISLEDAHRVVTTSTKVLEEVIPQIAWQVVRDEERKSTDVNRH